MPKVVHFGEFFKPEACGPTVLPDRSVLIGQNAKIQMRHFVEFSNIVNVY